MQDQVTSHPANQIQILKWNKKTNFEYFQANDNLVEATQLGTKDNDINQN